MNRYLRIGMDLLPLRDRGGEISNRDLLRGGRAQRLVRTLNEPGFGATAINLAGSDQARRHEKLSGPRATFLGNSGFMTR